MPRSPSKRPPKTSCTGCAPYSGPILVDLAQAVFFWRICAEDNAQSITTLEGSRDFLSGNDSQCALSRVN